jgi:hypothetical protein
LKRWIIVESNIRNDGAAFQFIRGLVFVASAVVSSKNYKSGDMLLSIFQTGTIVLTAAKCREKTIHSHLMLLSYPASKSYMWKAYPLTILIPREKSADVAWSLPHGNVEVLINDIIKKKSVEKQILGSWMEKEHFSHKRLQFGRSVHWFELESLLISRKLMKMLIKV